MKKQYLARVLIVLSLGLLCNVAWAETYAPVKQTGAPTDGYYLIYSESSSGAGWVYYNENAAQGKKYRVDTDIDLSTGVTDEQMNYVWELVNDEGQGTFTLLNMEKYVYMPADEYRNLNMTGSTLPANLTLTAVEQDGVRAEGKWFVAQTNYKNGENTLFIHTNAPGGHPCLSYWDGNNLGGTSICVQFYKVDLANFASEEEVAAVIKEIIAQTGATGPQDMGKVMGVATKQLAGKAEGRLISTIVKVALNS